jgi:hypothetical protein
MTTESSTINTRIGGIPTSLSFATLGQEVFDDLVEPDHGSVLSSSADEYSSLNGRSRSGAEVAPRFGLVGYTARERGWNASLA